MLILGCIIIVLAPCLFVYVVFAFSIVDCDGDTLNLAFVQYCFKSGTHSLTFAPHGNAYSQQPYVRTKPSTICKIKEKGKQTTAKHALKCLNSEAGGILEASSASSGRQ